MTWSTAVMPTEAGIQYLFCDLWIPAFAGMTWSTAVMPAEAGIQGLSDNFWIPAFAGMTSESPKC